MKLIAAILAITLTGCAGVTPPPGQETKKEFTQELAYSYKEVYRTTVKQMTECYGVTGMLGNGYKVIPEFDPVEKQAMIEVTLKGWIGDDSPDSTGAYRLVTIQATGEKTTRVTVKGALPKLAYETHLLVPKWVKGYTSCT